MSEPWDALAESLGEAVRGPLRDFWRQAGVEEFARAKLRDMAREKWRALNAATTEEREVHEESLRDLSAHVRDEALKLAGKASKTAKGLLGSVLETAGGVLVAVAKSWLEDKLGG